MSTCLCADASEADKDSTSSPPPDVAAPPPASAAAPPSPSACTDKVRDVLVQKLGESSHNRFSGSDTLPSYPWIFCWAVLLSRTSLRLLCSSSRADTSSCSYTLACWSFTCRRRSTCFVRYWRRDRGRVRARVSDNKTCTFHTKTCNITCFTKD